MDVQYALSIRQPWAWLIVNGYKDIENRKWKTNFRGNVWVHTGKSVPSRRGWAEYSSWLKSDFGIFLPCLDQIHFGGVVGKVEIVDCVNHSSSRWWEPGGYGFVMKNALEVEFCPMRGRLGFFKIPFSPVSTRN